MQIILCLIGIFIGLCGLLFIPTRRNKFSCAKSFIEGLKKGVTHANNL